MPLKDSVSGELLVRLQWRTYYPNLEARAKETGSFEKHLTERDLDLNSHASNVIIGDNGKLCLSHICYTGLLIIEIKRAKNLPKVKGFINIPNMYVKITRNGSSLKPVKEFRTEVRSNTLNPM